MTFLARTHSSSVQVFNYTVSTGYILGDVPPYTSGVSRLISYSYWTTGIIPNGPFGIANLRNQTASSISLSYIGKNYPIGMIGNWTQPNGSISFDSGAICIKMPNKGSSYIVSILCSTTSVFQTTASNLLRYDYDNTYGLARWVFNSYFGPQSINQSLSFKIIINPN